MYSINSFRQDYSFNDRCKESSRVLLKYPERRPIICERCYEQPNLPNIDKKKYLIPLDLTLAQFMFVIKKRLRMKPEEALFFFINNRICSGTFTIGQIYNSQKDPDGFLYIQYSKENVFG